MTQEKAVHTIHADVLIVAGGNNDKQQKWIPTNLPDQDRFQGKIYHSSDVTTADMLQSMRNIVVVGGSKSAYDIATLYPEKTSLVMRNPHYFGRRWLLLPPYVDRLVYFMEHHFRIHREERSMLYRFLEAALWIFSIRLNPPKNLSVMEDILRGGGFQVSSTHAQFLKAQRLESIHTASIARFTRDGVVLTTGENLKADAVVFGTGFRPIQGGIHHILSAMHKSGWILQDEKWWEDGVYLHRYMYHPKMPDCYWIGFKDPNSTTCLTCNAQALWAVHCAAGRIVLPDSMEIAQTLEKRRSFAKTQLPASHRRAQYDYLGVDCDYSYAKSIVQECGLGDRLPSWWCRPFSRWSATGDFAAAFAAKPCTARAMVALESVSESLIEEDDDDSVSMCLDENGKSAGLVAAGHGSLTLTNDTGSLSSSDRTF